ncbi:hypothetical protein [Rhizobium leguminosarum]|uniref:hypothetical protein n=1 Tax=Rhizobium leguminosarum TaxID=384 RepID=UPI0010311EB0|nr:hypothetical protein [Rhizobium leguminosarum]TAY13734.1 hypothetical protein ELH96_19120 [Rhizobium leguminosarum]
MTLSIVQLSFHVGYFSIGLKMAATVYIQADSLAEAQGKLEQILLKSIDARDARWFSDASFGTPSLPEISFATAMEIRGPAQHDTCKTINIDDVEQLMLSSPDASKSKVLPRSPSPFRSKTGSFYWADLEVRTVGIMKFETETEAKAFLSQITEESPPVHWEMADEWFELDGLENAEYPLILSPNIEVLAISDALQLELHWSLSEEMNGGEGTRPGH